MNTIHLPCAFLLSLLFVLCSEKYAYGKNKIQKPRPFKETWNKDYSEDRSLFQPLRNRYFSTATHSPTPRLKVAEILGLRSVSYAAGVSRAHTSHGFGFLTGLAFDYYVRPRVAIRVGGYVSQSYLFGTYKGSVSEINHNRLRTGTQRRRYTTRFTRLHLPLGIHANFYNAHNKGWWMSAGADIFLNVYVVDNVRTAIRWNDGERTREHYRAFPLVASAPNVPPVTNRMGVGFFAFVGYRFKYSMDVFMSIESDITPTQTTAISTPYRVANAHVGLMLSLWQH